MALQHMPYGRWCVFVPGPFRDSGLSASGHEIDRPERKQQYDQRDPDIANNIHVAFPPNEFRATGYPTPLRKMWGIRSLIHVVSRAAPVVDGPHSRASYLAPPAQIRTCSFPAFPWRLEPPR
jgi:hypothetical protein